MTICDNKIPYLNEKVLTFCGKKIYRYVYPILKILLFNAPFNLKVTTSTKKVKKSTLIERLS